MVAKLFNDLVTALDILPDKACIDLCVHHPETCAIRGKIRVITKRPCLYRSLVLTLNGTALVYHRQGTRSIKAKQVFLHTSTNVHSPSSSSSSSSVPVPSSPSSTNTPLTPPSSPSPLDDLSTLDPNLATPQVNQLLQGVNDIDFILEFPSHFVTDGGQDSAPVSLPSGPIKTVGSDSSISYKLSAQLIMFRRDILVNNQITVSMPFRIQAWQDPMDRRHSEDHSYHGTRRGKIEFQFQVPKQLDSRRLHELQLGFEASWRTLETRLRVREIQYYLVEEEFQQFPGSVTPQSCSTIISTSVTHDCSQEAIPANTWGHLRTIARLSIPQANTVLESTAMSWPHTLIVSHKLRVIIRFDQSLCKERDLQLSFPIQIHPTLEEDGSPVHTDPNHGQEHGHGRLHGRHRRRRGHALYAAANLDHEHDLEDDEDVLPLPMYDDREASLLLMVGEEIPEVGLEGEELDTLGASMAIVYPDQTSLRSPSEGSRFSFSSYSSGSSPQSPVSQSSFMTRHPVAGEQHAWSTSRRSGSISSLTNGITAPMSPSSPSSPTSPISSRSRSSIQYSSDRFSPPPYGFPVLTTYFEDSGPPPPPLEPLASV